MGLSIEQWHQRYLQQARWTHSLRMHLYQRCGISQAVKILDVGCGTGVLEQEFAEMTASHVFGVDIDYPTLKFAQLYAKQPIYTVGDGLSLPYRTAAFDMTLCHFLLLWIRRVPQALAEMVRVTRPGGFVLALAEPDYGGRIDFPDELAPLASWQTAALQKQGADLYMGRRLRSLFSSAGLLDVEVGVLGAQWSDTFPDEDAGLEWQVLESDLQGNPDFSQQAERFKALELASRETHQRILFVPVFYAIGKVAA